VLAVGVFCSLIVAVATPPWEANDEPDHVRNVETLVAGRWYHITDQGSGAESHQPPLYYLLLASWQRYVLRLPSRPVVVTRPGSWVRMFRHDVSTDGAHQRLVTLLRLVNVLLGLLTVLLTWLAIGHKTIDARTASHVTRVKRPSLFWAEAATSTLR
jgi:hypothetical protein